LLVQIEPLLRLGSVLVGHIRHRQGLFLVFDSLGEIAGFG